jgi:hypothetical protein
MSSELRALPGADLASPKPAVGQSARLPRSRPRGPVIWVALLVIALAAIGVTAMALTSSSGTVKPSNSTPPSLGLPARAAASDFTAVGAAGQVPGDVLAALYIPRASTVVGHLDHARGVGAFDATVDYRTPASYDSVISFFKAELTGDGWSLKSQGPATNVPGEELLAWRAGSDGNYWEVGAVVSLPPAAASYSQGGGQPSVEGPTRFAVRLFQVSTSQ